MGVRLVSTATRCVTAARHGHEQLWVSWTAPMNMIALQMQQANQWDEISKHSNPMRDCSTACA